MAQVLVTGATGTLGREVVARLLSHHHRVRIFVHRDPAPGAEGVEVARGDLATGAGLDEALAGVDAVLHLASDSRGALVTDVGGTHNLLAAAQSRAAPAPHVVYCSIVGVDHPTTPYYVAKRAAAALIEASGVPWSILRATQFHEFIAEILRSLGVDDRPQVTVPSGVRVQSIDVGEVAERLVALVELGPLTHIAQMGGPQVLDLEAMATSYLRAHGRASVRVRAEPLESPLFDAWRTGANLAPDHAYGVITWEEYVASAAASRE